METCQCCFCTRERDDRLSHYMAVIGADIDKIIEDTRAEVAAELNAYKVDAQKWRDFISTKSPNEN